MRKNTLADVDRWFWPHVDRSGGPSACWLWGRSKRRDGYGAVRLNGQHRGPHQVAYWATHGPTEHDVLHRCGTRLCCNPVHLYDGTDVENAADRAAHGRTARPAGEKNARATLTEGSVRAIRADPRPAAEVADEHGISKWHVWRLKRGERWAHITDAEEATA